MKLNIWMFWIRHGGPSGTGTRGTASRKQEFGQARLKLAKNKIGPDMLGRAPAHGRPQGIVLQEIADYRGQTRHVPVGHQVSGVAVLNDVGRAAVRATDGGFPEGHRLNEN